jgi:hypothetical protein
MHRGFVVLLPLTVLLASGCGAAPSSKSATSQPHHPASPQPARIKTKPAGTGDSGTSGSGGLIFFVKTDGSPPPTAQELYGVFRRPPWSSDVAAQQLARADALLDSVGEPGLAGASLGRPLYADTRLIVGNVGDGVYALPTTSGAGCVGAVPNGGGGCGGPVQGLHGLSVEYDAPSGGLPLRLYGLVGDDVRRVDVVVDGVPRQAELGENGYRIELADAGWNQVSKLVLHLRSGATEAVPLQP